MDGFKYRELVERALISVVKEILENVSQNGLCGDHHFYIKFRTDHPMVIIPLYLREKHPEEIMIVVRYRFWNLNVTRDGFNIDLEFSGIKETLTIPFSSLITFVDPSAKFVLQFTPSFKEEPDPINPEKESIEYSGDGKIISFDSFRKK